MSASFTPKPVTIDQLPPGTPVWVAMLSTGAWVSGLIEATQPAIGMVQVGSLRGLAGTLYAPVDRIRLVFSGPA